MSGGHFNYNQNFINYIADEIEEMIANNNVKPEFYTKEEWEDCNCEVYPKDIIEEFKKAVKVLRCAYVYAQRIDWLVSGDDDKERFHCRLREELEA